MSPLASSYRQQTGYIARYPHVWVARDGGLDCRSRQTWDLTRAAAASSNDSLGNSNSANQDEPRLDTVDWHATRDRTGLLLGTGDLISHDWGAHLQAMSGLLQFQERGTVLVANAGLWYIGNDAVSGVRIYIDSTGSFYRLTFHDGSTSVTSTLAVAPSANTHVELYWILQADGKVQLSQSISEGLFVSAALSGALTLSGKAFPASTRLRWNSRGTGNIGTVNAFGSVLALRNQSIANLQATLR